MDSWHKITEGVQIWMYFSWSAEETLPAKPAVFSTLLESATLEWIVQRPLNMKLVAWEIRPITEIIPIQNNVIDVLLLMTLATWRSAFTMKNDESFCKFRGRMTHFLGTVYGGWVCLKPWSPVITFRRNLNMWVKAVLFLGTIRYTLWRTNLNPSRMKEIT